MITEKNINFGKIAFVDILEAEMTYRICTEEVFDPIMTNILTELDGWQHYETKTVEHREENGYEYLFDIEYVDGTEETLLLHESSPDCQRLIKLNEESLKKEKNAGAVVEINGHKLTSEQTQQLFADFQNNLSELQKLFPEKAEDKK